MSLNSLSSFRALSRRAFVRTGSTITVASAFVPSFLRTIGVNHQARYDRDLRHEIPALANPDFVRRVALAAIDAAKTAGATYADVRLTRIATQFLQGKYGAGNGQLFTRNATEREDHGIGVRVLVDGAWGFVASPYWTIAEAGRLAKDAVAQARENARIVGTRVELAPAPAVQGTWATPHEIDPFTVPLEEKFAFLEDSRYTPPYRDFMQSRGAAVSGVPPVRCRRVETTVATTDGTLITQQYYTTDAWLEGSASIGDYVIRGDTLFFRSPRLHPGVWHAGDLGLHVRGAGWEALRGLPAIVHRIADDTYAAIPGNAPRVGIKPVSLGRFTVVVDSESMATLLGATLQAMDTDRVLGDEVNSAGASWLGNDPVAMLGSFDFGSPLLSVTASRDLTHGPTQTRWDDEGVATTPISLIQHGILQDLPTTREKAAVLAPAYQRLGRPVRSNGCAMATSAFEQQVIGVPDAVMTPGTEDVGFSQLVASVSRGYALMGLRPADVRGDMQMRQFTGFRNNKFMVREIVNGRLGAWVGNASVSINTPELWKNLTALGGSSSLDRWTSDINAMNDYTYSKGQPLQSLSLGVQAVPGLFQNMTIIDSTRGA